MAEGRAARRRTASAAAVGAAPRAPRTPKLAEIPLGVAFELPSASFDGELVPIVNLTFDPASQTVVDALANPKSLRVKWPIGGKVNHLHDLTLPCVLRWRVNPTAQGAELEREWKNNPDGYLSDADGEKTELVIDGSGRFKVLVDGADPVIDFITARLVGTGTVGFSISLQRPSGLQPRESIQELAYSLPCKVDVALDLSREAPVEARTAPPPPPQGDLSVPMSPAPAVADHTAVLGEPIPPTALPPPPPPERMPCLGDRMTFNATMHDLLRNADVELRVVEKESGLWAERHDVCAWSHVYSSGKTPPCTWTIGFADKAGSSGVEPRFSYDDDAEEGGAFEYGWELHAKSPNPRATNRVPILASKDVILVKKPQLDSFHVSVLDAKKGEYEVSGAIYGFSPDAPPVRLALMLVDRLGARFPEGLILKTVLGKDGTFKQSVFGPKATAAADGSVETPKVFAILSLLACWKSNDVVHDPEGSIAGFLGFDDEKFAYYHLDKGTTTESKTLWVCSEEWVGITPRKGKKERDELAVTAPGPDAGGYQYSELTFADVWNDILAWEGFVKHMYLDSEGLVTVAAGYCLAGKEARDNPARALALTKDFTNRQTGRKLTAADEPLVRKTFATVLKMPPGHSWIDYETSPLLQLDDAKVKALSEEYFQGSALPGMHTTFGKDLFDSFPKCARRALMDIAYNAGPSFLKDKSPLMKKAILETDWLAAANQVPKQGRASRKAWRQELLRYAHFIKTGERV
jgi:GH24 family phage-related lysozyme (muramidase)